MSLFFKNKLIIYLLICLLQFSCTEQKSKEGEESTTSSSSGATFGGENVEHKTSLSGNETFTISSSDSLNGVTIILPTEVSNSVDISIGFDAAEKSISFSGSEEISSGVSITLPSSTLAALGYDSSSNGYAFKIENADGDSLPIDSSAIIENE